MDPPLMPKLPLFALLVLLAPPAAAQNKGGAAAAPVCPGDAEPLPAEMTGWANRQPLAAATDEASLGRAVAAPGVAFDLSLSATPAVRYVVRPAHPGGSVSHGGMVRFAVDSPGLYRVAIGSGAWLDVVADQASLDSVAHGHGPNCSGIRKMVDFQLKPGIYTLQIAGNGEAQVPVLIVKLK